MPEQQDETERARERVLIVSSQRGDRRAFNHLVERHQSGAYALALRMLGNPDVAADVTQDAFVSAFRAIASCKGDTFRPWLYRIVSNGCYDYWRAQGRHPTTSLDAELESSRDDTASDAALPSALIDPTWDPERIALRAELIEHIQQALLKLPAEQRLAVILSDMQGFAYEEIAGVMGTSVGTVKSRIFRARGHLRDILLRQEELFGHPRRPASRLEEP